MSQWSLYYFGVDYTQLLHGVEPTVVIISVAILAVTVVAYFYWNTTASIKSPASLKTISRATTTKPSGLSSAGPPPDNDVWEERRRRGIEPTNPSSKKDHYAGKPFGSSYYFAHNSANAKGGYKDGLRMEDFTMNGPRLLSKSGLAVTTSSTTTASPEEKEESKQEKPTRSIPDSTTINRSILVTSASVKSTNVSTTPITKYLWDDPGDASGVATIRIDSLPAKGNKGNSMVPWKDADIIHVTATLEGEGLLVIATDHDNHEFRLVINRLYDKVTQVKTIVKQKRLLIKIHKYKGGYLNFLGKSNLEAWPHPQRK